MREFAPFLAGLRYVDLPDGAVELEQKARNLAAHGGGASGREMGPIVARIWGLEEGTSVRDLLPEGSG